MKTVNLFKDSRYKAIVTIPGWADNQLEGGGGPRVLAKAYAESVWASRCVSIRANLLSSIPWAIVKDDTPVENHELIDLIQNMDDETNWEDALRAVESDMCIYGVGYILKIRAGNMVVGLRRLNPMTMEVVKSAEGIGGFVQNLGNQKYQIPREDMIYFHEYSPIDDLGGLSMTAVALPSITALTNTEKYLSAFFENSALPSIIMTTEQSMQEEDFSRLQRWWRKTFQGVNNSHKVGFMTNGVKPETISYPLTDLALEQVRETCRRDICGVFGVPPSIAGAWESANYATAVEERRSIYTETLIPRARYYQSQINTYLVEEIDPTVEFQFLFDELEVMQPDKKIEAERLTILVNAKIIKPEVAALEMGYTEEDVPEEAENPVPEQLAEFTGLPKEEIEERNEGMAKEPMEEEPPSDESQFKAEIGAWRRKALRTWKAEQKATCDFVVSVIPGVLEESIKAQLEAVENVDDIRSIFDSARLYNEGRTKSVMKDMELAAQEQILERIELKPADVIINYTPPEVVVNIPEIKVPKSEVVVNYTPPPVNIPKPTVIQNNEPRTRKIKRDAKGKITEITEDVV